MPKKKKKPLSFAETLAKTMEKHNRRQNENMALFRAEQKRQRKKEGEPIDLLAMVMGKKGK